MDGGGRVVESLAAGAPGGLATRARPALLLQVFRPLPVRRSRRRRPSVAVPLASRIPRLAGTWLTLAFFAATGATGAILNGQYDAFTAAHGDPRDIVARGLGLGIEKVTISGVVRLSEADILRAGGITANSSLPFLSAARVRDRLAAEPFITSVSVRKLYPDEVAISLVEREPYALWQLNGDVHVIAADGTAIDLLRDPSLASLPLVVGEGANARAGEYLSLLDAAGPLRGRIRAGMLVSGRRWTLKLDNGLDIRLPEDGAASAVARLIRLQREAALLDKDVLAIDLRLPDRVVVRLTEEAAAARAEAVKKKLQRGVKGIET